eukprot:PITA_04873
MEYVTKWVEAEALPRATEDSIIHFLLQIFMRYAIARDIIMDGGLQFVGNKIAATLKNYHIQHKVTTPYHPQANDQVESTNKIIEEPIFPIEFEIQTLRRAQEVGLELNKAEINRLQQINELDEIRLSALQRTALIQQQRSKWHDALIKKKVFCEGDWTLLYDSRFQDFPGKLQTYWLGPYEI